MIVVDSSVAVKWVLPENHSDRAQALYASSRHSREQIIAPPLLRIEVTNVIWQRVRRREVAPDRAGEVLDRFFTLSILLMTDSNADRRAFQLARAYDLPAAYDAYYISLAEHTSADLWTADQRLLRALGGRLPFVRWIGDYA